MGACGPVDDPGPMRVRSGLGPSSSQAKTGHVNGASRKREPHDNVQDRAQKNFPSNGFAGHTPSFRLSWIDDTISLSRGTRPFLLLKIIRSLAIPADVRDSL